MQKTLYISDLDGTLLNSRSEVSEQTKRILDRLIREKNALFSVATARTPATVVKLLEGIATRLPYIVMTGAAMWREGIVNRHYMRKEEADRLLLLCREAGIQPFLYTFDNNVITAYHSTQLNAYDRDFMEKRIGSPYKRFVLSDEIPEEARQRVMLLFVAGKYGNMGSLYEAARTETACSMTFYRDIFDSSVGFLEVMAEGVSKAAAVADLKKAAEAERVVVFGDSPNDLSMRTVADLFVAPGNASGEVKAVADLIIGTNDEDCVAQWIEQDLEKTK